MQQMLFFIACLMTYAPTINGQTQSTDKLMSFYQANLVCGAASDIGCGTRAKPILHAFMNSESVKEAWLNHSGTIVAVIWNDNNANNQEEIANVAFGEIGLTYEQLQGDAYAEHYQDFTSGTWYLGNDVDQLSMIEAKRIASSMTDWMNEEEGISSDEKIKLQDAFEQYIKQSFLAIEDADVINQTSYWRQWEKDLTAIGKEISGEDFPAIQIVSPTAGETCTPSKSCCTKEGTSSTCCTKPKKNGT